MGVSGVSRRAAVGAAAIAVCGLAWVLAGCAQRRGDEGAGAPHGAEAASSRKTVRFGCDASYVPYEWRQEVETAFTLPLENAEGLFVDGYDVQFMKAVADELGCRPVVVDLPHAELVAALCDGRVDAVCSGMSATEARRRAVDFSEPYLTVGAAVMVAEGSAWAKAASPADLRGARVLGQRFSPYDEAADQIPDVVHLDPVDYVDEAIERLLGGGVDAVMVEKRNKNVYEETYPGFTVLVFEEGAGFDVPDTDPCVAAAKGDPLGVLAACDRMTARTSDEERQQIWDACCARAPQAEA